MIYFIKSYRTSILILIISSLSYTAQARVSLTNFRADLNAAVIALQAQITALQEQVDTLHPIILYEIGDRGSAGGSYFMSLMMESMAWKQHQKISLAKRNGGIQELKHQELTELQ